MLPGEIERELTNMRDTSGLRDHDTVIRNLLVPEEKARVSTRRRSSALHWHCDNSSYHRDHRHSPQFPTPQCCVGVREDCPPISRC